MEEEERLFRAPDVDVDAADDEDDDYARITRPPKRTSPSLPPVRRLRNECTSSPFVHGYRFPLVRGSPVTAFSSGVPNLGEKLIEVELEVGVPQATD